MKFCDMMACASCGNALCSRSGFAPHCLVREMDHGMQTMQVEQNVGMSNTSRQTQYKTMNHILYYRHMVYVLLCMHFDLFWLFLPSIEQTNLYTLPKTTDAPEKPWLVQMSFLLGFGLFSRICYMLVSWSVSIQI